MDRHKHNTTIRIKPDMYAELDQLSKLTRTPISEIASDALRYALNNSHLVQADCYDVVFGRCGKKKEAEHEE